MKKYALPQRLADMEHILASELADHLDDYLDRCSADNIGFIVDTDKKSYVLCPARWFDYTYNGDNYHIIYGYGIDSNKETWDNCKVRYLGKRAAWKVDNLYTRLIAK